MSGFEKMPNKFRNFCYFDCWLLSVERHGHQVKKITRLIDSLKQEKVTRITLGGCVIEKTIWVKFGFIER